MKTLILAAVAALSLGLLAGCQTTPATSPAQTTLNTTAESCKSLGASMDAVDAAIKANVLKGQDARNALQGLTQAQAGCVAALGAIKAANAAANPPAKPASGV
jgi:hypothetical protein